MFRDDFEPLVLAIVLEIPEGKVASYSQIARLAGYPKHARSAGKACSHSEYYGEFPCHRVVNSQGRLHIGWDEQRELLEKEGISFLENGCVDMKKHQWEL